MTSNPQTRVLHGSAAGVYINGKLDDLITKVEAKITGDFTDQNFCGDYATYPIYNGYSGEGTLTDMKENTVLEQAIVSGYESGAMPDITLITYMTNPNTKKTERWSYMGVVFTEVALANVEAKNPVERELPFKFTRAQLLEVID